MNKPDQSPEKPNVAPAKTPVSDVATPQDKMSHATPAAPATLPLAMPPEFGGRKGPEATRYGDWEMNGKCVDF